MFRHETYDRNGNLIDVNEREFTAEEKEINFKAEISHTENPGELARKLEEVIDYIENGTSLSQFTKDWLNTRKEKRAKL